MKRKSKMMEYIFISFCEHLNKGLGSNNDFYNVSLTEQYKLIKKRIPKNRQCSTFKDFIETCFPSGMSKYYYFSCPNFLREKHKSGDNKPSFLNNVVLRPEITNRMKQVLPDNQNIILIGDIYESNKLKMLIVKGIQLIDSSMSSPKDMVACKPVCNSFERKVWAIKNVDYNDTFFTPNKVDELIRTCFTVSHPEEVRKTYEDWNKYIEFRNYYLREQSKRNFKLDRAEYVKAYAVNRKEYLKHSSVYDEYLLDGLKTSDMIVLTNQVENAEAFPLIRLDIERNKKKFDGAKINKHGKLVNEEERRIYSLARDNVFITALDPKHQSEPVDKNNQNVFLTKLLNDGYTLGDRFKIIHDVIKPNEHLEKIARKHVSELDSSYRIIDTKYEKQIRNELEEKVIEYKKANENSIKTKLALREHKLASMLDKECQDNADSSILEKIKIEKTGIKHRLEKEIKKLKDESNDDYKKRINESIKEAYKKIDIKSYYIARNTESINKYSSYLNNELKKLVSQYQKNKKTELTNKYSDDIRNEKIIIENKLDEKFSKDKEKIIEEETIIRFSLYFRLENPNNNISDKQIKTIRKCKYIAYDNRAEKAKISRQERALQNFYSGYVKNPYLSTYLFDPEELKSIQLEASDWRWYLESLNEKQKEAVRKAISSNSIFLLQGPPGTGKTQVIAEIVAQLVKKGKKILISSETHKAIDNVFDRLPKIAEIVPIRLIPSTNDKKKSNQYDPKFLLDNFYLNISTNMNKSINRYRNFKKYKEEFSETYGKLKIIKSKIEKSKSVLEKAFFEIKTLENQTKYIKPKKSDLNEKIDKTMLEIDILKRTRHHIEKDNFHTNDGVDTYLISELRKCLEPLFDKSVYRDIELDQLVQNIDDIKPNEIISELSMINPESSKTDLEIQKRKIKTEMDLCKNDVDEVLPEKKERYDNLQKQLRVIINKINVTGKAMTNDSKLDNIFNFEYLVKNTRMIYKTLETIKNQIREIKSKYVEKINSKISIEEKNKFSLDQDIKELDNQIKNINNNIIDIQERSDIKEIQDSKNKLENGLIQFFKDFEISEPFKDADDALVIIKNEWEKLETNFAKNEKQNKEKIPMYEKIVKYITSKDVINSDRKIFTKDLFESANVFGITCTSNYRFTGRNVDALSEYNIDDFDIKSVGIDVVIIDEVSKSSFIDLLIPILYGKTVILVGDHRQLPPMYEFSKLHDDDFKGLDESIINKDINKKFTTLYEKCFFKTLFEKIPECYKTMLVKQYRCHEHIMNVFNHFYQGELKIGWDGQNNNKCHNVRILSNGRNIIEPDKHVYFVNCSQNETHESDSTSMYNTGEAKVVTELLRKLNTYFKQNPNLEKLSIGVICTYGDQARKIKEIIKSEKIKTDGFKTNVEKMIVSTVDDFQGDERDIIILSTVRNPENPARSNPGFILAYQRINVALSRARRMLIMVGNRKYLEDKGVIDLPDVHGRPGMGKRNFRVYEEILSTIERYGQVIDDVDVLDHKETKING